MVYNFLEPNGGSTGSTGSHKKNLPQKCYGIDGIDVIKYKKKCYGIDVLALKTKRYGDRRDRRKKKCEPRFKVFGKK